VVPYSCPAVFRSRSSGTRGLRASRSRYCKDADPFFVEDLEAAQALVDSTDQAELFVYPGAEHLFADSSLSSYDPVAAALLTERVLALLDRVRSPATASRVER
jgi:dienelactone hydrolase